VHHVAKSTGKYVPDQGDVVWVDFDPVKGHEQGGRRPALVMSPVNYNSKVRLCLACPITSHSKGFEFEVPLTGKIKGVILADQIKTMAWGDRNCKYVTRVDESTLMSVSSIISLLLLPESF